MRKVRLSRKFIRVAAISAPVVRCSDYVSRITGMYPIYSLHFLQTLTVTSLYSLKYVHRGLPKMWTIIPSSQKEKLEEYIRECWGELASECSQFVHHLNILIEPIRLREMRPSH